MQLKPPLLLTLVSACALLLSACAATEKPELEKSAPIAVFKPDVDYSDETPDCKTAAARIEANIKVGTPLSEVRRLVGKPAYRFPGSWWWSGSFNVKGHPSIFYDAVAASSTAVVSKFSFDISRC